MARYRIVKDRYLGYEVQVRRLWFPFWVQLGGSNTFETVERAEEWARRYSAGYEVVKDLGDLKEEDPDPIVHLVDALEQMALALDDAKNDVSYWATYAEEYRFDRKDFQGTIDRIDEQIQAAHDKIKTARKTLS